MFEVDFCKEPLDIKYRLVDVDTLICIACQEFLSLIIAPEWQENLFKKAEKIANENSSNNDKKAQNNKYDNIYNAMKELDDISQFDVTNLDITIIHEIVWNCPELLCGSIKGSKHKLSDLLQDRNEYCHSHKHETSDELYNRGINYLNHLRKFVSTVEQKEKDLIPDDNTRSEYFKKYIKLIGSLNKILNKENKENNKLNDSNSTLGIKPDTDSKTKLKKSGLTVGGVSGSRKMRLGRVHKKKEES